MRPCPVLPAKLFISYNKAFITCIVALESEVTSRLYSDFKTWRHFEGRMKEVRMNFLPFALIYFLQLQFSVFLDLTASGASGSYTQGNTPFEVSRNNFSEVL